MARNDKRFFLRIAVSDLMEDNSAALLNDNERSELFSIPPLRHGINSNEKSLTAEQGRLRDFLRTAMSSISED